MSDLCRTFPNLPPEQQAIRAKCFHPSGAFIEFKKEEVEQSIPDRFERIVARYPERIAVKIVDRILTYDELNATANRVAHAVVALQGSESEPVGLLFERDPFLIAAVLGILKAGKFLVLLDPAAPKLRTTALLADSQAKLLITNRQNASLAAQISSGSCRIMEWEETSADQTEHDLTLPIDPASPMCIMYTSGSTGEPKGVLWSHRNWLHKIILSTNIFLVCDLDRITLLGSPSSPNAITTLFLTLLNGATLLPFDFQKEGARRLAHWLSEERISFCLISAPLFRALCENLTAEDKWPDLRLIRVASEAVYKTDVDLYKKHFSPPCVFATGLSIAETGYVRVCYIDHSSEIHGNEVPVGYAVEGKEILLLNDAGEEARLDEVGEIVVKSRHLSSGYWRRPDLTEAKFKPDPGGGDSRLYFTGDLGLMRPDGCLIHQGRKDFRVKIRGYGVEIAEVEKALREHAAVAEAVVVARPNKLSEASLVAYFTSSTRPGPSVSELQKFLKQKLSDYMIPSAFVMLDRIPLTANGKIDRQALPEPGTARPNLDTPFVAPRTKVEHELAEMWREVLGKECVGMQDNFFDLGGDSLLATKIIVRIKRRFDLELPLATLFDKPTISELAESIVRTDPEAISRS